MHKLHNRVHSLITQENISTVIHNMYSPFLHFPINEIMNSLNISLSPSFLNEEKIIYRLTPDL